MADVRDERRTELDALIEQVLTEDREVKSPEMDPAMRHNAAFWTNHRNKRDRLPNLWNPPKDG